MRRTALRNATLLLALSGCVEGTSSPGHFGEVRVEPAYRARYEPDAIGVTLDTAHVVVTRSGSGDVVLDHRVAYSGGALAWIIDLEAEEESLDISVELWSGTVLSYAGDTSVTIESDVVASGESHHMSVAYRGPAIVSSLAVSPDLDTLRAPGATRQFMAEARDPDSVVIPGAAVTWTSTDAAVVMIDAASGLATAVATGTATITATSGSRTATAALAVKLPPATVTVTPAGGPLQAIGATRAFTAVAHDANGVVVPDVTFTWASSDVAVATIDAVTGLATATGHGSANITASTGPISGSETLNVNLVAAVADINVAPPSMIVNAFGVTKQYTAVARDASGQVLPGVTFTWTSSAPDVATIDAVTGLATSVGNGSTTITATAGSVEGGTTLTVSQAIAMIMVTPDSATLELDTAGTVVQGSPRLFRAGLGVPVQEFIAEGFDAHGHAISGVVFVWASSDTAVATVDEGGFGAAVAPGIATITATAGGVTGAAILVVR